jgi:HlyD family secretion protein
MNRQAKWLIVVATVAVVALLLALGLQSDGLAVDTAEARRGTLTVTVSEQGRTRARLPHTLNAPVAGELQRITLLPGDHVSAGDVLARISVAPDTPRNRAAIDANLDASRARLRSAEAGVRDAESALQRARREAERREQLFEQRLIGEEEREQFIRQRDAAETRLLEAQAGLGAARADVAMAEALQLGSDADEAAVINLRAPADGTIFRVHERNQRVVQAGAPVLSLSNADALELEIDLLTRDAVRVAPGDVIRVSGWGGDRELGATVRYIEPEAFTRVSALGVEEQRVNVIADLDDPPPSLGAGYRVEASIVVSEYPDVLLLPANSVFRRDGSWHTFVVEDGRARLRSINTGARDSDQVEITEGIQSGEPVILYPSEQIEDGSAVVPQTTG